MVLQTGRLNFSNVYNGVPSEDVFDCLEGAYLHDFFVTLRERMGSKFDHWRFLVIHHNRKYGSPSLPVSGKDVVLIWLSDESGHVPIELRESFKLILKSYWPHKEPVDNIHPFPLCGCSEVLHTPPKPFAERQISVFFLGNLNANRLDFYRQFNWLRSVPPFDLRSYPLRLALLKVLKATKVNYNRDFSGSFTDSFIRFTGGFRQGLKPNEYAIKLADTKIALCPPGFHSAETIRHFEAMRMGCVVVSAPLPPNPFYDDSPVVHLRSWRDLHSSIDALLPDQKRLLMLSEQTTMWWEAKCSPAALANKTDMLLNK